MAAINPVITIWAGLSYVATSSSWTDITTDLVATAGLTVTRGKLGGGPMDLVADTGRLTFVLNNTSGNSGGRMGYYSPYLNNFARTGWKLGIPIRLQFDGANWWTGYLDSVAASPNRTGGDGLARCVAVDWMDVAARQTVSKIQTLVNTDAGSVVTSLVNSGVIKPQNPIVASTGNDSYLFALDTARIENTTILAELQRVTQSELGFFFIGGNGAPQFTNRLQRSAGAIINGSLIEGEYQWCDLDMDRSQLLTRVRGAVYPRTKDAGLVSLYNATTTMFIGAGGTLTFTARYTDPNQKAARVGGTGLVQPVAGTDYVANVSSGGGGVVATAFITVSTSGFGGDATEFTLTNTGTSGAFVTQFALRGQGLYTYSPVYVDAVGTGSTTLNTVNEIMLDMPYQSYTSNGQTVVAQVLRTYYQFGGAFFNAGSTPTTWDTLTATHQAIRFDVTTTALKDKAFVLLGLASHLGFSESVNESATSAGQIGAWINGSEVSIATDGHATVTWHLFRGWST